MNNIITTTVQDIFYLFFCDGINKMSTEVNDIPNNSASWSFLRRFISLNHYIFSVNQGLEPYNSFPVIHYVRPDITNKIEK